MTLRGHMNQMILILVDYLILPFKDSLIKRSQHDVQMLDFRHLRFVIKRPQTDCYLVTSAALIDTSDWISIRGLYAISGILKGQPDPDMGFLVSTSGKISISRTIDPEMIQKHGADCFQNFLLVENGHAGKFNNVRTHNCRAIAIREGHYYYIETSYRTTLMSFARILEDLGVDNAIYLDSGTCGYGRCRDRKLYSSRYSHRYASIVQNNWIVCD